MSDIEIIPYREEFKKDWDNFVRSSKNGTFLLERGYMDYHSDRFHDCSLLFKRRDKLYALLPACADGDVVASHAGLTYGGLVMGNRCTTAEICDLFTEMCASLRRQGMRELIYKPVPHIYHTLPAEEDLYALFRHNARLAARNVASVIFRDERIKFRDIRKAGIRKALREGIKIRESDDFSEFWKILTLNLHTKYAASPVHSLSEISLLASRFPDNIKLFMAESEGEPRAGVVMFVSRNVAHTQYISASPDGKEAGALDLLFDHLINDRFKDKRYFDFGTSNEDGGRVLNEALIYQKEGFGGRAICYNTYSVNL